VSRTPDTVSVRDVTDFGFAVWFRQLIAEYRGDVEKLLEHLNETNLAEAVELASWPEYVSGYGHVKDACLSAMRTKRTSKQKREEAQVLDRRTG
jgi:hypothetical protein